MKKMRKPLLTVLIVLFTMSIMIVSPANAATQPAICFKGLTDVSELNDSDSIQIANTNGPTYLSWFMNLSATPVTPALRLGTTEPSLYYQTYTYSKFYIKKYSSDCFGIYVINPYDGKKYFMSSSFLAEPPKLVEEQLLDDNNKKWYIYERNSDDLFQFLYANPQIPVGMYLLGNPSLTAPTLDTYNAGNYINSVNWSIKKAIPVDVTYTRISYWGNNSYDANITITNNSNVTINNWTLKCTFNDTINSIWGAQVSSYTGSYCVIGNAGWNSSIAPNQSVTFGFAGSGSDGSVGPYQIFILDN